jgi:SAM-dependent methyltransferase
MNDPDVEYWEDLARRQPYFPVLASDGRLATEGATEAGSQFFATGEADISTLLAAINSLLGCDTSLGSVLDFGCGVGRLTLPLARRARYVAGCDITPTILELARGNAKRAGLDDIDFLIVQHPSELPRRPFDFICSLSVFRHIPASQGYELTRSLARLLAPGGIAALQMPLSELPSRTNSLLRFPRRIARKTWRGEDVHTPPSGGVMNAYNVRRVCQGFEAVGARTVACFADEHGRTGDAVLIFQMSPIGRSA